jgi:hypothetical protein
LRQATDTVGLLKQPLQLLLKLVASRGVVRLPRGHGIYDDRPPKVPVNDQRDRSHDFSPTGFGDPGFLQKRLELVAAS